MAAELLVFLGGVLAGTASALPPEGGRHPVGFRYDEAYIREAGRTPLSVSIPVVPGDAEIGHWLDGLLPDDGDLRDEWADREGVEGTEAMSLLGTRIGLDCAGSVQFCARGRESEVTTRGSGVKWRSEGEIADWIRRAKAGQRTHIGEHGWYSLGGYQTKMALYHDSGQWGSPFGRLPTTHILKPGIAPTPRRRFDDSDLVEHLSMAAAANIGLDVATTRMGHFGSERVLVVERYDREPDGAELRRVHQEDLCQALGRPTSEKYQSLGGPTPADIADLIRHEAVARSDDLYRFVDGLIFNWAIGATDGHAKNYSLLLEDDGVSLAPLYDIMSHLPYRQGRPVDGIKTAMRVGKTYRLSAAGRASAWERMAEQLQLDPDVVADRAEDVLRRCPDAVDAAIDALEPPDRTSPIAAVLSQEIRYRRDAALGVFRNPWTSASISQQRSQRTQPS